jgi:hypothetical protein
MKINQAYFKSKIKALQAEYTDADRVEVIKGKGGRCELCGRREGDIALFGPTHYIKKRIKFKVHIHVHKIISDGVVHKVVLCSFCHASYHLFNRLDSDALFGNRTIGQVANHNARKLGNKTT